MRRFLVKLISSRSTRFPRIYGIHKVTRSWSLILFFLSCILYPLSQTHSSSLHDISNRSTLRPLEFAREGVRRTILPDREELPAGAHVHIYDNLDPRPIRISLLHRWSTNPRAAHMIPSQYMLAAHNRGIYNRSPFSLSFSLSCLPFPFGPIYVWPHNRTNNDL